VHAACRLQHERPFDPVPPQQAPKAGGEAAGTFQRRACPPAARNVPVLLGSGSGASTSTAAAVSGLYDRFSSGDGAHVSLVTYNTDGSSSGAGGSVAEGLKFSLEGGLEFTDSTLYSASYFVPGQSFVTWKECLGA